MELLEWMKMEINGNIGNGIVVTNFLSVVWSPHRPKYEIYVRMMYERFVHHQKIQIPSTECALFILSLFSYYNWNDNTEG